MCCVLLMKKVSFLFYYSLNEKERVRQGYLPYLLWQQARCVLLFADGSYIRTRKHQKSDLLKKHCYLKHDCIMKPKKVIGFSTRRSIRT